MAPPRSVYCAFSDGPCNGRNIYAENGVSLTMRKRWKLILPTLGLVLFGAVSYRSYESERSQQITHSPSKYFYWSLIRLHSDPLNKRDSSVAGCKGDEKTCVRWDLSVADKWIEPALIDKVLILSALPAFFVGALAKTGLGNLGIRQISSFMVLMPLLIFAWFYFVSWLLERLIRGVAVGLLLTGD